jgi:hypothetical protein
MPNIEFGMRMIISKRRHVCKAGVLPRNRCQIDLLSLIQATTTAGSYTATATAPGTTGPANFSLTNI